MENLNALLDQLGRQDITHEEYNLKRVKIINNMTHSSDPRIEVESEESEDDEFISLDLLNQLVAEQSGEKRDKRDVEVGELLERLARTQAILIGDEQHSMGKADQLAFKCAVEGNEKDLRTLLNRGVVSLNLRNLPRRDTLLIAASRALKEPVVQLLLESKCQTSIQNKQGQNALHVAAASGASYELLKELAGNGVDAFALDHMGHSAFSYIADTAKQTKLEQWLRSSGKGSTQQGASLVKVFLYVKSGTRYPILMSPVLTVGEFFEQLPSEFRALQPILKDIGLLEYRRKTAQLGASFTFLDPDVVIVDRVKSWEGDFKSEKCTTRLMLVPRRGCPPASSSHYNKAQL